MWALRRAFNPLRSCQGSCLGSSRACLTKLATITDGLQHGVEKSHIRQFTQNTILSSPKRFYQSSNVKFSMRSCGLSSQAGKKSSEDEEEDNLEDGFSELETPPTTDTIDESTSEEEVDELLSEPELSDEDGPEGVLEKPMQDGVELPKAESEADDESLWKKKANAELLKVVLDAPRPSTAFGDAINKWVEQGKPLGRTEISLLLLNLRKRRLYGKALQFSEWLEANGHLEMVERDYASRLDLIFKIRGLHRAEKYIESIPKSFRGEVVYRTLLANCVAAGNSVKAEEVFNKMRDLEFEITAFACNQLLLLYKRLDKKKIGDLLKFMESQNIKPSLFTYRLLIDTKGQSNDIEGMEQLVETMKEQGFETDITTQSMVARHYINAGLNEKAEAILNDMEGCDLKEARGACQALLPLYADLGKIDDVRRVWKVCESHPRVDECLAAIEAWGKLGQIEEAEAVFDRMVKTWKKLSARNYTSLLKVYANHKLLAKGKDLAKRMAESGCYIGPLTWDALVRLYVEAGEVEKADSILYKATKQNKLKPLFNSFMVIMDQYAKRGDVHNCEKMFHRLRQAGYVGRIRQYQALLLAYINAKTPAYGFRDRMKADNVFPNKTVAGQLAQVDAFKQTAWSDLLD